MSGAPVIGLIVQGIVLSWILKIEKKCECSKDWRRDYMKFYSIISIALTFLLVFLTIFMRKQITNGIMGRGVKAMVATAVLVGLAGLVNLASILSYIPSLKKRDCTCAIEDDWRDNFIFWWTLIGTILMFVIPLVVVTKKLAH